ncbi:SWIM zinc finger family protein [Amycolatopsis sp. NPDC059657]|uniref:SWIM zinc finger family protein n=1 Tax=Amycolatopsis sp. NPDC059657 TaxID=3346899 RepID=UPI00366FE24D
MSFDHTHRYQGASSLSENKLLLSTAERAGAHPEFFSGSLTSPAESATALLAVAEVAGKRYYTPPAMLAALRRPADPVVTSDGERLRFESFSACCGVYARYDLLADGLDGDLQGTGTTNVDVNEPLRKALTRIGASGDLRLHVGPDRMVAMTGEEALIEKRVPLPQRWLRGFAEVQAASARTSPRIQVGAAEAVRFLRGLPRHSGRAPLWAVQAGSGLRLTSRPSPRAVCLAGTERLRGLLPLLRFVRGLVVHGPEVGANSLPAPSVWEWQLSTGRVVLALSPELSRGFSGEGSVLSSLSEEGLTDDAELIAALRVGYDVAESAYFPRELPFDPAKIESKHPRLKHARQLVAGGLVRSEVDGTAYVRSGELEHRVTGTRCTCQWWTHHQGSRGPCKHVLAAKIYLRGGAMQQTA